MSNRRLVLIAPHGQGLQTYRILSAHSPDIPIVILTGDESEATRMEAQQLGCQEYIFKSQLSRLRTDGLVQLLLNLVERQEATVELQKRYSDVQAKIEGATRIAEEAILPHPKRSE